LAIDTYLSVATGEETANQVTKGGAASGEPIELTFDKGAVDRLQLIKGVETILKRIQADVTVTN
jgi:hypothetical protein